MSAPVLEQLEERAGASDADREEWLAARRQGVTATEIRDLYLKKITIQKLVRRKLGLDVDTFTGNVFTAWGNVREPLIAEVVEKRYGIRAESRVFRAVDEPRFLASPDGVGVNFDEELQISEIKTGGKDLAPWLGAYVEKGYGIQQQWGMRVVGARRSLFAWEHRDQLPDGQFVSGRLQFAWIERDDALIEKLEKLARRFLAALDEAIATGVGGGAPEPIDEALDTHAVNYLRGLDLEKQGKALKEPAYRAIVAAGKSQTSLLAKVTFTPASTGEAGTVEQIDYEAAEAASPELFAAMRRFAESWAKHCEGFKRPVEVPGKTSPARATITAVKPPKAEEQEA